MTFSVIIPCFNAASFLDSCLQPFLTASFSEEDFEVILINDGSLDATEEKIKYYAKNYSFVRGYSQDNEGVSVARNVGISKAKGRYLLFLDADDAYLPTVFQELLAHIKDATVEVVEFDYSFLNARTPAMVKDNLIKKNGFVHYIENAQVNSACNKLYKKAFLLEYEISFDDRFAIGEDLFFNIKVFSKAKNVISISEKLLIINRNENSVTRAKILAKEMLVVSDLTAILILAFSKLNSVDYLIKMGLIF